MKLVGTVRAATMKSAAVHFKPGDVLYGRLRPYLNKVYRPDFEGLCSGEFIVFPVEKFESKYLQYFLNSSAFVSFASHLNAGDRPRVDFDQLAGYPFPLPPRPEQRRIVAEIEKQFTRLDAAVAALRRIQANLKRYRAALLKAAVEGRLVPTEASWKSVELNDLLTELRNGISIKPDAKNGLAILRISAVRPMKVNLADVRFLRAKIEHFAVYRLEHGDLLFTRYNGNPSLTGVCGMVQTPTEERVYPDKLIRCRVNAGKAEPRYLQIALNTDPSRTFIEKRIKTTAGQAGISGADIKRTPIPLPPMAEQLRIADECDRRLSTIGELEAQAEMNLKRAERLRQAILKHAFEGKLVPQDPNDEPASVLLERIRAERSARESAARISRANNHKPRKARQKVASSVSPQ